MAASRDALRALRSFAANRYGGPPMPNPVLMRDWTDSVKVNKLDRHTECFFTRLMQKADDYGRHSADLRLLKSRLFPLLDSVRSTDISRQLAACEKAGLVRCYTDANGRKIVEILKFGQRKKWMKADHAPPEGEVALFAAEEISGTGKKEPPPNTRSRCRSRGEGESREPLKLKNGINGAPTSPGTDTLSVLKSGLGAMYKRESSARWTYAEEQALTELSQRPGVLEEFELIKNFRRFLRNAEQIKFFPQKLYSLVSEDGWQGTLDKAKIQTPGASARRQVSVAVPSKTTNPSSCSPKVNEQMLRESIAFLEKDHPNSPMLVKQREQLKNLEAVRSTDRQS